MILNLNCLLQVVRNILENLNVKDLLQVSRVNKLWKREARSVLRNERKCLAVIDGAISCLRASDLNDMVGALTMNFFNGLFIRCTGSSGNYRCEAGLRMEEVCGNLLNMPIKHLKIEWSHSDSHCVLYKFMLRLLTRGCRILEHLRTCQ